MCPGAVTGCRLPRAQIFLCVKRMISGKSSVLVYQLGGAKTCFSRALLVLLQAMTTHTTPLLSNNLNICRCDCSALLLLVLSPNHLSFLVCTVNELKATLSSVPSQMAPGTGGTLLVRLLSYLAFIWTEVTRVVMLARAV